MRGVVPGAPAVSGGALTACVGRATQVARMDASSARLGSLIEATARRDRLAFAELYRLTSPRLFALARRFLPAAADAEDALQDAYMRIWQRAGHFDRARGDPLAWMAGVLRNASIDRLRARGRTARNEESLGEIDEAALPAATPGVERLAIGRCLGLLAAAEQQVVLLAVREGFSHTEVSARLGLPIGTVKSHARRGLAKLRLCLEAPAGDA